VRSPANSRVARNIWAIRAISWQTESPDLVGARISDARPIRLEVVFSSYCLWRKRKRRLGEEKGPRWRDQITWLGPERWLAPRRVARCQPRARGLQFHEPACRSVPASVGEGLVPASSLRVSSQVCSRAKEGRRRSRPACSRGASVVRTPRKRHPSADSTWRIHGRGNRPPRLMDR
jgi:hypothetical protein